jgi:Cutinase
MCGAVAPGDTLWGLSKKFLGSGAKWRGIYEASRSVIESAARAYGHATSNDGNLIFPGTSLTRPGGSCLLTTQQPAPTRQQALPTLPASCSKPLMIGVRGSNENPTPVGQPNTNTPKQNLGDEIGAVYDRISGSVQAYPLPYPAVSVPDLQSDMVEKLWEELQKNGSATVDGVTVTMAEALANGLPIPDSVREGADLLEKAILDRVNSCPDQKIVLAGYSQGSWVIRVALDALSHRSDWSEVSDKISGVGLLADPYNVIARPALPKSLVDAGRTQTVCLPGDPVCKDPQKIGDCAPNATVERCEHLRYALDNDPTTGSTPVNEISLFLDLSLRDLHPTFPPAIGVPSNPLAGG